ncbi:MAG: YhbY family RNA-binding protein [Erysipelothrix sp.]
MLNKDQKKELRRLSHNENTVVSIGKNGLTETVLESFELALVSHNLVKVGIQKNADITINEVVDQLVDQFACELVSKVGRVAVLYRYSSKGRIKV